MDDATRAKLDALPKGHPIRAIVDNGGRHEQKTLVLDGVRSWYAMGGGFYDVGLLSDVVIAEVTWPPAPLPTGPGTVVVGTIRGVPGRTAMRRASGIRTYSWVLAFPIRELGESDMWAVPGDEITDWRVVYEPEEVTF